MFDFGANPDMDPGMFKNIFIARQHATHAERDVLWHFYLSVCRLTSVWSLNKWTCRQTFPL